MRKIVQFQLRYLGCESSNYLPTHQNWFVFLLIIVVTVSFSSFPPGEHVKLSGKKLRDLYVACPEKTVLVTCFGSTQLLGHAFATVWEFDGGTLTIYLYKLRTLISNRHYWLDHSTCCRQGHAPALCCNPSFADSQNSSSVQRCDSSWACFFSSCCM